MSRSNLTAQRAWSSCGGSRAGVLTRPAEAGDPDSMRVTGLTIALLASPSGGPIKSISTSLVKIHLVVLTYYRGFTLRESKLVLFFFFCTCIIYEEF